MTAKAGDDQSNLPIKAARSVFRMDLFRCKLPSRLHSSRSRYRWYQAASTQCLVITPFAAIGCLLAKKKRERAEEKGNRVLKAERKRSFTCVSVNTASKQGA